jgi:aspartate carbamoyltransferase catalytic subunit
MKHLLDTYSLTEPKIREIFAITDDMHRALVAGNKSLNTHVGKSAVLLFYENSTRTALSFEKAAQFLGMSVTNLNVATSSVQKGENIADTARTINAYKTDLVIMRHQMPGASHLFSQNFSGSVINGGDGSHSHPTQALYDAYTMQRIIGNLTGKKVAIVGDIKHSRVARSNMDVLKKLGANVTLFGPRTLIPAGIERTGAQIATSMTEALTGADIVMTVRIQNERAAAGYFPSVGEYARYFGLNTQNIMLAKPNAPVLHPAPVNWGVEISIPLVNSPQCVKDLQAEYGLALRMALIKTVLT